MAKKEFKSEVIERVATLKEGNSYSKEVLRIAGKLAEAAS